MHEPAARAARLMTADELFFMPDDGFRHEVVRGELRTMTPRGGRHGEVVVNVTLAIAQHVQANSLGRVFGAETGFRLASDPDTVRAPDVAFVRRERIPAEGVPERFWSGPPDLAVEVLSPSDTTYEVDEKVDDWLRAGTRAVWVVNPRRRTVTVYSRAERPLVLAETETLHGGDVLPGIGCLAGILFSSA